MGTPSSGKELLPVYLFYGNEGALVEEGAAGIREEALAGGMRDLNYHLFTAKEANPEEVVTIAMTMPAMAKKRVIVIKGIDGLKARQQEALVNYLKDPSPSTCLILTAETVKVNKGSALYRAVAKCGHVELFNRLSTGRLAAVVKGEVKKAGKSIADEAVSRLLALTGNNLRSVRGELEKILLFVGDKQTVDLGDVEEGAADVREENAFALSDAIGKKEGARALEIFKKVSGEPPLKVVATITRQFRIVWKIKALRKKGVEKGKWPALLRIPPYQVAGYGAQSGRFSETELLRIFQRLKRIDREIKSGGVPPHVSLSRFIVELCL